MADTSLVAARLDSAIALMTRVHLLVYSRAQTLIGIGVLAVIIVVVVIGIWRRGRG